MSDNQIRRNLIGIVDVEVHRGHVLHHKVDDNLWQQETAVCVTISCKAHVCLLHCIMNILCGMVSSYLFV